MHSSAWYQHTGASRRKSSGKEKGNAQNEAAIASFLLDHQVKIHGKVKKSKEVLNYGIKTFWGHIQTHYREPVKFQVYCKVNNVIDCHCCHFPGWYQLTVTSTWLVKTLLIT